MGLLNSALEAVCDGVTGLVIPAIPGDEMGKILHQALGIGQRYAHECIFPCTCVWSAGLVITAIPVDKLMEMHINLGGMDRALCGSAYLLVCVNRVFVCAFLCVYMFACFCVCASLFVCKSVCRVCFCACAWDRVLWFAFLCLWFRMRVRVCRNLATVLHVCTSVRALACADTYAHRMLTPLDASKKCQWFEAVGAECL